MVRALQQYEKNLKKAVKYQKSELVDLEEAID